MAHRAPYTFLSLKHFRYGLQALRYSITSSNTKSPNGFLQNRRTFSPNRRPRFRRIIFLQISKIAERFSPKSLNVFSKLPTTISPNKLSPNHQTRLLQIANVSRHMFSPNCRTICCKRPRYFADQRAAYFLFCSLRRRPSLRSLPTRATGSALCVMGGQLWFLGRACFSYTCTGSALDVMDYGLSKAESSEQNLLLGRRL